MTGGGDQPDLLSDLTDLDFARHLLAEMHDDLARSRYRMLTDFSRDLGPNGTMIFGGPGHPLLDRARSSFVHGNFAATILLCGGWSSIYWRPGCTAAGGGIPTGSPS